jgi:hypothetical protein
LGLGAASAAAQYVVTHPQTSHNPVNLDFLLDPLSKSEFLSFHFICALAVMKFFQIEGFEIILLCPKKTGTKLEKVSCQAKLSFRRRSVQLYHPFP